MAKAGLRPASRPIGAATSASNSVPSHRDQSSLAVTASYLRRLRDALGGATVGRTTVGIPAIGATGGTAIGVGCSRTRSPGLGEVRIRVTARPRNTDHCESHRSDPVLTQLLAELRDLLESRLPEADNQ
jgi:hypothetical protein